MLGMNMSKDLSNLSRFVAETSDVKMVGKHVRSFDILTDDGRASYDLYNWKLDNDVNLSPRKDEHYIIAICDRILRSKAELQHRFPFLLGDPGKNGRRARLPVDAYYKNLKLVVEYHEKQHKQAVPHFDKVSTLTVSGVHRGLQRKKYDALRQTELINNGLKLVIICNDDFTCGAAGRLKRSPADYGVVRRLLIEGGVGEGY